MSKKGFTLVELLAVIVILAIILVIAVPEIMSVIEDATKASFESSAKMVASQVENQYTIAKTLGKEFRNTGSCMEEWSGLNTNDYESCTYEIIEDGTAKVTLVGKGKFNELSICGGIRSSAIAIEGICRECPEQDAYVKNINVAIPFEIKNYDSCVTFMNNVFKEESMEVSSEEVFNFCNGEPIWKNTIEDDLYSLIGYGYFTEQELILNNVIQGSMEEELVCVPEYADDAVTYINNLYNDTNIRNKFGLIKDNTTDENIRYAGEYVQNYVEFGNVGELWRIIGIFEVKTAHGDIEELVKIVRDESFKDSDGKLIGMSWDSSSESINIGCGINEWSQADLKNMLNGYYLGIINTCAYCNERRQSSCSNDCSSSVIPINNTYESMIESVIWNTGAMEWKGNITPSQAYNAERGNVTGKECSVIKDDGSTNSICNDTVIRTTEWEGKIGLIYPSDFGYAGGIMCTNIMSSDCGKANWIPNGVSNWTILPYSHTEVARNVWGIKNSAIDNMAYTGFGVRPSLYLKSNVKITGGDGSENNPYKLNLILNNN